MIELVNLEECVGYVVKVNRRDDTTLYGKIRVRPNESYCPYYFDLGGGGGVCYRKNGRVMEDADGLDIIWIKKIAKEDEEKTEMTYPNEIEKTEGEIKVLQAKLELLKEMKKHKSPVEEAYKRVYGNYPDTGICNGMSYVWWDVFCKGYNASKEDCKVEEPKPMDDVIDRLVEKYKSQKLWNMVRNELGYSIDCCDEIVDLVEKWLPKEQSASGSQNVDTELLVDGHNHCLQKMKEMLR